ncbi:MAG: hypothetical protein SO016_03590 [Lachnospiraceae bacterium]|nr:hypothetical protein [Robinsoniella sp.]MDY3765769.1 hypothetical protein [Lachnospiraceae bacterium]
MRIRGGIARVPQARSNPVGFYDYYCKSPVSVNGRQARSNPMGFYN